jgi:isopentenyldiphosphate isomerase
MSEREKVYLVDKGDAVIGEKWRDQLTNDDCWRIIAVWIENSKGEILIQQRSFSKDLNPGLWTPAVVGTVTTDESYEQAALKELAEEVGVTGIQISFKKAAYYKANFGFRHIQTFSCKIDRAMEDFVIQDSEVEQIEWIAPMELSNRLKNNPDIFSKAELWEELYGFSAN